MLGPGRGRPYHAEVIGRRKLAIAIVAVAMAGFVLFAVCPRRPGLDAVFALVRKVIHAAHVLVEVGFPVEGRQARITFVVGRVVESQAAVVVARLPAGGKSLATRQAAVETHRGLRAGDVLGDGCDENEKNGGRRGEIRWDEVIAKKAYGGLLLARPPWEALDPQLLRNGTSQQADAPGGRGGPVRTEKSL